ncbi:MAG: pilus assembly protein TadG-related protein [Anaerolineae bacterium]
MKALLKSVTRQSRWMRGEDAGQAIVWVAVMLPLFLAIVGLTIDGGIVFSARRELQNVADSAARAGAMQIDQRVYRESAGQQVVLDAGAAQDVALAYVAGQQGALSAGVSVEPRGVIVQVERDVPTSFLRLVGIQSAHVTATAAAQARSGIERANR